MKHLIELFAAAGARWQHFGDDPETRAVAEEACRENGWFTPAEVCRAMRTLARTLLTPEALRDWLAGRPLPVGRPRSVLVVMAGNIPAVGFLDLLCVLCSGHRCLYKPAGKDRILMDYIAGTLQRLDPALPLERYAEARDAEVEAVIATGSDNAERYFRARYAALPLLLRGSRQSVAVLAGSETPEQWAGLNDDIWAYSGLGCRSVSLLLLPEGAPLALQMPEVSPKLRNNCRQTRALLQLEGCPFVDLGGAVAVEQGTASAAWHFPKALSEVGIARYRTLDEAAAWLQAHDREVQCVVTACLDHPRRTGFGCAQTPGPTDWPDGRDVLAWLAEIA